MNAINVYITPDGREVRIPDELAAKTKFTKDGLPDRRLKANADFVAWADAVDKQTPAEADPAAENPAANTLRTWSPDPFLKAAQAYALRVWNGQSPDVPRNERIRRVKLALEGQNLPFEGVELP